MVQEGDQSQNGNYKGTMEFGSPLGCAEFLSFPRGTSSVSQVSVLNRVGEISLLASYGVFYIQEARKLPQTVDTRE